MSSCLKCGKPLVGVAPGHKCEDAETLLKKWRESVEGWKSPPVREQSRETPRDQQGSPGSASR